MAKAKNTYSTIAEELDWLQSKADQIKEYVNDNPYHLVCDRNIVAWRKEDKDGEMVDEGYKIVATIEQIHKSLRDSLKEYGQLLEVIEKLREKEEARNMQVRGDVEVSHLAKRFTQ